MIVIENISKCFGKTYVLKNINLEFKKKEISAVIGPSGSGKSTLLRVINALETPNTGQVIIDGKKLTAKNKRNFCTKVSMVFQAFHLFPHLDVQNNLIYAPINVLGMKRIDAVAKAEKLLEQFGLKHKFNDFPANLSGGQKQRVAICRSLMMEPEVMLFDEPTSALDPENIKDIVETILLLKTQITMIIVTHHIKFAKAVADRIIFMDHGQVLSDQTNNSFFEKPKSYRAKLFLENIGDLM